MSWDILIRDVEGNSLGAGSDVKGVLTRSVPEIEWWDDDRGVYAEEESGLFLEVYGLADPEPMDALNVEIRGQGDWRSVLDRMCAEKQWSAVCLATNRVIAGKGAEN